MLLLSSAVLLVSGLSAATLGAPVAVQQPVILLYGLVVLALWHAPIYGWLLLVSGWARRAAFLWAVLPPVAICIVEKIAFNTSYFESMINYRLMGFAKEAFAGDAHGTIDSVTQLTPGKLPEHAGSLDRSRIRGGVSRCRHPAAPVSRTDLIRHVRPLLASGVRACREIATPADSRGVAR